jgi:hypothetical protein
MANQDNLLDQLGAAALEARELLAEIRGATRDMRAARRELDLLLNATISDLVQVAVTKAIDAVLDTAINDTSEQLLTLLDQARTVVRTYEGYLAEHEERSVAPAEETKTDKPTLASSICAGCGKDLNQFYRANAVNNKPPKRGDVSICYDCGHLAIFIGDGRFREPTTKELESLLASPIIQDAMEENLSIRMSSDPTAILKDPSRSGRNRR